jgi:murein DD-endopeptidase MepM/ murein hydrolase activator NlpD
MIDLIATQHVERRRPARSVAVIGSFKMDQIKQNPAHKRRLHKKGFFNRTVHQRKPLNLSGMIPFRFVPQGIIRFFSGFALSHARPAEAEPRAAMAASVSTAAVASIGSRAVPVAPRFPDAATRDRRFLRNTLIPVAGLLGLTLCFFLAAVWAWPRELITISPQADTQFRQSLAAYAGLEESVTGEEAVQHEDIPLDLMETFVWTNYTVKRGDSVSRIAVNHGISMDAIIASNNITNARRLSAGQVIRIPNIDGIPYTVKRGDSLAAISTAMGVPLETILDANDIQSDAISAGTVLFIPGARMKTEDLKLALGEFFVYPIRGRLTSPYGWRNDPISGVRRYHAALDLAAVTGTPIGAAMDGRVATVGYNSNYGNFIILTHGNGFQTLYAHMSRTSVAQGAYVRQGAKIGEVGSTGYSTGDHLHFAVYKNGRAVNPLDFLNP